MTLALLTRSRSKAGRLSRALAVAAGGVAGLTWGLERAGVVGGTQQGPAAPALVLLLAAGAILALDGRSRPLARRLGLVLGGLAAAASLGSLALAAAEAGQGGPGLLPWMHRLSIPAALAFLAAASALFLRRGPRDPTWAMRQAAAGLALVPLGVGMLGTLDFLIGMPLLYGTQRQPLGLTTGLGGLLLGLSLLGTAGSDAWPMSLFRVRHPEADAPSGRRLAHGPLVLFLLVGIGILGAGSLYLRGQIRSDRAAAELELAEVGDLKGRQISQWFEERRRDGRDLLRSGPVQDQLARFPGRGTPGTDGGGGPRMAAQPAGWPLPAGGPVRWRGTSAARSPGRGGRRGLRAGPRGRAPVPGCHSSPGRAPSGSPPGRGRGGHPPGGVGARGTGPDGRTTCPRHAAPAPGSRPVPLSTGPVLARDESQRRDPARPAGRGRGGLPERSAAPGRDGPVAAGCPCGPTRSCPPPGW